MSFKITLCFLILYLMLCKKYNLFFCNVNKLLYLCNINICNIIKGIFEFCFEVTLNKKCFKRKCVDLLLVTADLYRQITNVNLSNLVIKKPLLVYSLMGWISPTFYILHAKNPNSQKDWRLDCIFCTFWICTWKSFL